MFIVWYSLENRRSIINYKSYIIYHKSYDIFYRAEKKEPEGPPPEIGVIYRQCEVKGVHAFGVFVEVLPGYEGLIHISELDIRKVLSPGIVKYFSYSFSFPLF